MSGDGWRCRRCGSARWVQVSLTGPVSMGGKPIAQCVPCGAYGDLPKAEPEPTTVWTEPTS